MLVEYLKKVLCSSLQGESGLFFKGSIRNTKWDPVPEYKFVNGNQGFSSSNSASQGSLWLSMVHWDGDLLQKLLCAHDLTKHYYNCLASISVKPSTFCLDHFLSHRRRSWDTCRIKCFGLPCTCLVANSQHTTPLSTEISAQHSPSWAPASHTLLLSCSVRCGNTEGSFVNTGAFPMQVKGSIPGFNKQWKFYHWPWT